MRSSKAGTGRVVPLGLMFALAAIGLGGCGPSGPKLAPVEGRVTLTGGTPVAYGHVILHPDASRGNTSKEVCQGRMALPEVLTLCGQSRLGLGPGLI